ncbi:hypothetical protein [Paenibacillus sp. WLX2291]|uniref:hypothetical protein n=1 Tax=Paenibacillus sp. WLX2291 TaxID=3296934 RepID=UPI0039840E72
MMKKSVIWSVMICLIFSVGWIHPTDAATTSTPITEKGDSSTVLVSNPDSTVRTDVYTSQESSNVASLQANTTVRQAVYNIVLGSISNPFGIAYRKNHAYVAQGGEGILRMSLTNSDQREFVYGERVYDDNYDFYEYKYIFHSVTNDSYGNLYYNLENDNIIRKFTFTDSTPSSMSAQEFLDQSTVYAEYVSPANQKKLIISGLAFDRDNQLYISAYSDLTVGSTTTRGILKWNHDSKQFQIVFKDKAPYASSIAFDSKGDLYFSTKSDHPSVITGINKIPATALKHLPVSIEQVQSYFHDDTVIRGMIFLPDNRIYVTIDESIIAPFADSKPIVRLLGSTELTIFQGDPYTELGAIVDDENYTNVPIQMTYRLHGKSVSGIDTSVVGEYVITYFAVNPDGVQSYYWNRYVTVNPLPSDLASLGLKNPQHMDYANGSIYIMNKPGYDPYGESQKSGIYKVSLDHYRSTLMIETDALDGSFAFDQQGNFYFATNYEIGKLDARYLNTSTPITSEELFAKAEYFQPFRNDLDYHVITGLDFDKEGKLYITANINKKGSDSPFSILATTTATDLLVTEPRIELPFAVNDISWAPSGNLILLGKDAHYRLTASQLLDLSSGALAQPIPNTSTHIGIVILPSGDVYASGSTNNDSEATIQNMSYNESASNPPIPTSAYHLEDFYIPNAYGMDYHNGYVYLAQGKMGISRVSLANWKLTPIVSRIASDASYAAIISVALDSAGNLYYTTTSTSDEVTLVKRIAAADIPSAPISMTELAQLSTDYASFPFRSFSSLAIDPKDQLYIAQYNDLDHPSGIFKWNPDSKQWVSMFKESLKGIEYIEFDIKGNLYFYTRNNDIQKSISAGIYKIPADHLNRTLPLSFNQISLYRSEDHTISDSQSLMFLPNGLSYVSDAKAITRLFPASKPIISIDHTEVSLFQDDLYYERGFTVSDATYTTFEKSITYSLNGTIIPEIDIHTPGEYTVHYNAVNPAGVTALEKTRIVTVYPTPTAINQWDVDAIKGMGANSKDLYLTSAFSEQNPNYGLLKISTSTFKKTKIADLPSGQAVTANEKGDIFFSRTGFDNMFYKIPANRLTEGTILSHSDLMRKSQTFKPFTDEEVKGNTVEITGLDWDEKNATLYVAGAFTNKKTHKTISKIVRLKGTYLQSSTLVATLQTGTHDIEVSKYGNLYVVVDGFQLYQATAAQLSQQLPLTLNQFKTIDSYGDGAVVFLQDGQGYVSSMFNRKNYGYSLSRLSQKD